MLYFCNVKDKNMGTLDDKVAQMLQAVEKDGVYVEKRAQNFSLIGIDMVFPHVVLLLCLSGTAQVMFDRQEFTIAKRDLGILMPGHVIRRISCSEDYTYACVVVSAEMFKELKAHTFSHDYDKFISAPKCHLTHEQVMRMSALTEVLEAIASHDINDLQLRRQMLLSHMAVSYEFINYYRREQDKEWAENRPSKLYTQFCDLVVEHYTENRNVQYYAELLDYDARYFSKVFRQCSNGMSPLEWIQQYVATQAKRIMDANPKQTVKETAFQLGFPTTANFCRYFKRATGMNPQEYKEGGEEIV